MSSLLRPLLVIVVIAAVGAVAWAWMNTTTTAPFERPKHVVLISIDTLRADVLGTYGGRALSPRIDALAEDAVVFDAHISAAPTTLASHTSLFTGMHPHNHGIPRNDYLVPDVHVMLPEVLAEAGWQTAAFLGAVPIASHSNFTQGFEHIDERFTRHRKEGEVGQTQRDAPDVTDAVLSWVDDDRDPERPLFLFAHYFDVHAPYIAPDRYRALYDLEEATPEQGTMEHLKKARGWIERGLPKGKDEARVLEELYLSGVSWVDDELGRLFDGLDEAGILEDALVIVTADHGETFDNHDEAFDHGMTVYDESVRTPLIMRFPDGWRSGSRVPRAVSNIDVVPTLLEIFDLPDHRRIEGRSLIPVITGDPTWGGPRPVFSEATKPHKGEPEGWKNDPMDKMIRTDAFKLVLRPLMKDKVELYDLREDPEELDDLAGEGNPREDDLRQGLQAWREEARPTFTERDSSARRKAELQALGYLGDDE